MKRSIMLVEKDTKVLEIFYKRLLLEADMEIRYQTGSGYDGYTKFQVNPCDLVLLNLPLLDVDGFQLLQQLKQIKPDTYVIVVLDMDNQMARSQLQMLGITDIFVKPYDTEKIIECMKAYIKKLNIVFQDTITTQAFGIGPVGVNAENQNTNFSTTFPFATQSSNNHQANLPFGQSQNIQTQEGGFPPMDTSKGRFSSFEQKGGQFGEQITQIGSAQPPFGVQFPGQGIPSSQMGQAQQSYGGYPEMGGVGGFKTIKHTTIALNCPKGGVGKTTISTNIATALSMVRIGKQPLRVALVDLDLEFGDVCTALGMQPHPNIMNWISDINAKLEKNPNQIPQYTQTQIEKYMLTFKTGLKVLSAPANHSDIIDVTDKAVQIVIDNLKANGGFDVIVFDTGNNTAGYTLYAMFTANSVYEIVTMDVSSMNDLSSLLKTLRSLNFPMSKMKLVVNRLPKSDKEYSIKDISQALGLEVVGVIPEYQKVRVANNAGEPLVMAPKDNEFTLPIKMLCNTMLGVNLFTKARSTSEREPQKSRNKGFLGKLLGKQ